MRRQESIISKTQKEQNNEWEDKSWLSKLLITKEQNNEWEDKSWLSKLLITASADNNAVLVYRVYIDKGRRKPLDIETIPDVDGTHGGIYINILCRKSWMTHQLIRHH